MLLSPARWDREDTVARGGKWGSSLFLGTAGEQSGCLVSSPVSYRCAEGKGGGRYALSPPTVPGGGGLHRRGRDTILTDTHTTTFGTVVAVTVGVGRENPACASPRG